MFDEDTQLNTQLGLTKPTGLSVDDDEIYDELFDLIRLDYTAGRVKIADVPKILNAFSKKDSDQKAEFVDKIYQSNFAPKIEAELANIPELITDDDEDYEDEENPNDNADPIDVATEPEMITWDEYEARLEEQTKDLTPEQKDLFYYIHFSELEGESIDQRYVDYVNGTPAERQKMDEEYAKASTVDTQNPNEVAEARIAQAMNKRNTLNLKNTTTRADSNFNKPFTAAEIQEMLEG